jgi:hypothetical protein
MYEQKRRDQNQALNVPDPQQDAKIANVGFTPTDPRFRDANNNRLNPNSEGRIQGVENSQAQANYKAYTALRSTILETADAYIKAEAQKKKEDGDRAIDQQAVMNIYQPLVEEGEFIQNEKNQTDLLLQLKESAGTTENIDRRERNRGIVERVQNKWTAFREDKKLTEEEKQEILFDIQQFHKMGWL